MNNAIKLAVEKGGYEIHEGVAQDALNGASYARNSVVLSPKFWQALGKVLGWEDAVEYRGIRKHVGISGELTWLGQAMAYYELVLTGGSTEKFWKDLLK